MELRAKDVADIIVSAGLASNFGAIRALAIEGIQKGHMALHSKNIANSVLDEEEIGLVDEVAQFMIKKNGINADLAKRYIARKAEFGMDGFMMADDEKQDKNEAGSASAYPGSLMVEFE